MARPGIFQPRVAYRNCCLLQIGDGLTLIDAIFPGTWPLLVSVLDVLRRARISFPASPSTDPGVPPGFLARVHTNGHVGFFLPGSGALYSR